MTMRAVSYAAVGATPVVTDVEAPACPSDGAVIAVQATGVCRSDWHAWVGHEDVSLPHVPGHEFAGVVAEIGAGVRKWAVGDRVTVPFVCACGQCPPCRAGEHQVCADQYQPGFSGWGSFAERVAIRNADLNLIGLPDDMDAVVAAGLGCRFSTAYRAVLAQGRLGAGQWLAVHGCGGVGLAAIMIAKSRGARVVAVDVSAAALVAATSVGADVVVRSGSSGADHGKDGGEDGGEDVAAVVRRLTDGGAHVSIDAFGSAATCANSILGLRRHGRHVQVGLLAADDDLTAVPMGAVLSRELEIVGSHGMSVTAFPALLADIAAGRLDPSRLVARIITLAEAPAALVAMNSPDGPGGTTIVDMRLG